MTELSANQISTFNDSPPSGASDVPSANTSVRPPLSVRDFQGTKVKFNEKKMTAAVIGAYTRSCCPSTKNALFKALFCRQKRITEKGRPTPKLNSLTKASKVFMCHFKDCNYECYEWLTANTEHKLFCWPCSLFNTSKGTWNDRPMDFIYKWQVSALLFDEYCIMHIVMEVYVVCW